jgi:integrase
LQVFPQTGIRVSELCSLTLSDIDLADRTLTIRQGKGMSDRTIELEKKGYQAIRNYLQSRQQSLSDALFLNGAGQSCRAASSLLLTVLSEFKTRLSAWQ